MVLEIIAIIISLFALVVSIIIWLSDKKSVWYWNIVIVPIQEIFKDFKKLDISDKTLYINTLNGYSRNLKDYVSFLEISISKKEIAKLKEYIEDKIDKVIKTALVDDGGNYLEIISSFEVKLYKKIAKLILKRVKNDD